MFISPNEDDRGRWQPCYISEQGIVKPDVLLERFKQLIDEAIANRQRSIHDKLGKVVEFSLRKVVDSRGFNSLCHISGWPDAWNSSAAVTGLDMKRLEKL